VVARSLEARGVAVDRVQILGDDLDAIADAVRRELDRGIDLVCTTGGLGPTHDDLTMEAVARATGRALALDPGALALVERRSRGIAGDPQVQRAVREKQATLPAGSTVLAPAGTAPGCALRHDRAVVVVLPGPPWELEAMWEAALGEEPLAGLLARAVPPAERVLRVHAMPESRVVEALAGLDPGAWERLRVGICARDGELEITVRSAAGADGAADALERLLARELGEALYSRDGATVDEVVARALTDAGQTLAVASRAPAAGSGPA
jgi:nicotinamide-nucleotide amidase